MLTDMPDIRMPLLGDRARMYKPTYDIYTIQSLTIECRDHPLVPWPIHARRSQRRRTRPDPSQWTIHRVLQLPNICLCDRLCEIGHPLPLLANLQAIIDPTRNADHDRHVFYLDYRSNVHDHLSLSSGAGVLG